MTGRPGDGERVVVVGAGMAADRLVAGLAERPPSSDTAPRRVTVLGDESHAPYNRILLSALLEGTHRAEALALHPPTWYAAHDVELRSGARAVEIDRAAREVELVDGERVPYDRLVLATGSIPSLPPIRGLVQPDGRLHAQVHAFRHLDDCTRLLGAVESLPAGARAVVVGGGLLGLQVARALAAHDLAVEVVEGGGHLLRSQVDQKAGAILARDLRRLGTEVYTGARAVRLREGRLTLDNGYVLSTDLVVLATGGRPSTALARRAGLTVGRGIVVDEQLTTTDPAIHAIGDCAERDGVATGFVPPAWEQADVLAGVIAGEERRYDGVRQVARLRATDLDVAVLGEPEAEERAGADVVEVTNPVAGSHRRLLVRDGRIVAAVLVGDLNRIGLITQAFDRRTVLGPSEPADLLLPDPARRRGEPGGDSRASWPDDAEVCACVGVSAGRIRACAGLEQVRTTTRATTGCGGCADTVRHLLATRPGPPASNLAPARGA